MKVSSHEFIVVKIVGVSDLGSLEWEDICGLGGFIERRAERETWG